MALESAKPKVDELRRMYNRRCFMKCSAVPLLGLLALSMACQTGCRRVPPPGNTTVQGRVTFQGQPLAGGLAVFTPDPERGGSGKPISAEIQRNGWFQLSVDGEATVPPGWYRVAIAPAPNSGPFSPFDPVFPLQLARPDQSGLIREVKAGQENNFNFQVEVPLPEGARSQPRSPN
jgi:hypothetical protein